MKQQTFEQQLEHLAVAGLANRWLSLSDAAEMSKLSYYELGQRVVAYHQTQEEQAA